MANRYSSGFPSFRDISDDPRFVHQAMEQLRFVGEFADLPIADMNLIFAVPIHQKRSQPTDGVWESRTESPKPGSCSGPHQDSALSLTDRVLERLSPVGEQGHSGQNSVPWSCKRRRYILSSALSSRSGLVADYEQSHRAARESFRSGSIGRGIRRPISPERSLQSTSQTNRPNERQGSA